MIDKTKARLIVKEYLDNLEKDYLEIDPEDKIRILEVTIPVGKYEDTNRTVLVVCYTTEDISYPNDPLPYFVHVDAETEKILYTMTEHGYLEP